MKAATTRHHLAMLPRERQEELVADAGRRIEAELERSLDDAVEAGADIGQTFSAACAVVAEAIAEGEA